MKRLISIICGCALLLSMATVAWAAASAELTRIFAHQGMLYAYVDITEADTPITKASAKIGSQSFPASGALQTVAQAGAPIYCMLLLDVSNSMPDFAADVRAFADDLAAASGANTRFMLATFGNEFKVVDEDIQPGELPQSLDNIAYVDRNTRMYGALAGALDYFAQLPRNGHELYSVIILTDGVVYNTQGGITYDELLARMENTDIMLHSVGFGEDTASLDSLGALTTATQGKHYVIGAELDAAGVAANIRNYMNSLYLVGFSLADYTPTSGAQRVTITFASGAELICKAEAEVIIPVAEAASGGVTTPQPGPGLQTGAQSAASAAAPGNTPNPAIIVAAVVAMAVVVGVLLLRRKKAPPVSTSNAGIFIRLEVLQGNFSSKQMELNLVSELFVGGDKACAIAFSSANLPPLNSRIFTANGAVYIEDLHAPQGGTFVNGMRIEMANILRSGDEISVGDAVFRLKF